MQLKFNASHRCSIRAKQHQSVRWLDRAELSLIQTKSIIGIESHYNMILSTVLIENDWTRLWTDFSFLNPLAVVLSSHSPSATARAPYNPMIHSRWWVGWLWQLKAPSPTTTFGNAAIPPIPCPENEKFKWWLSSWGKPTQKHVGLAISIAMVNNVI